MVRIQVLSALAGLEQTDLAGTCVAVIDVFRASTTVLCLMENGAQEVIVTDSVSRALERKQQGYTVIGERGGRRVAGFDLDNSPYQVSQRAWESQKVVVTTSNGTRALIAVQESPAVILAGFRNLDAAADHLRDSNRDQVTLIPIGSGGEPRVEDELCAQALQDRLQNEPVDVDSLLVCIRRKCSKTISSRGPRYQKDVDLALQLDTTRIVPVLEPGLVLRRVFS